MKKQKGFSLIETLITVTLIAVSGLAAASFADIVGRMTKQTRNKSTTGILKAQITSKLFNEQAWSQTYLDPANANMQCLRDGDAGDCSTVGSNLSFHLLDARGDVVSDPSNPNLGFTEGGLKCSTFVSSPNDCPFRIGFTWTPICPATGTCPNPQVLVTGTFQQNVVNGTKLLDGKSATFNFLVVPPTENFSNPLAETDTFFVDFNNSANPAPSYTLDVLFNDITETGMPLKLGVLPSATSTKGGSLTISSDKIVYVPPLDFYGVDTFQYVAQDIHGHTGVGVVWIRVMTPFTWTGEGNGKASSANNWCGTVTSNLKACSHLGVTTAPKFTRYLIFNENCIGANCNPDLDFAVTNTTTGNDAAEVGYVHITSGFSGNITQSQNLIIKHDASNSVLPKLSGGFLQEGATFTGGSGNFIKVSGFQYDPDACGTGVPADPAKAIRINGGTFIAPGKLYSNMGIDVATSATFNPANGEVIVAGSYCAAGQGNSVNSPNATFHLLTLGSKNGTVADFSSSDPVALSMSGDINTQDLNFNTTDESFSVYSISPSTNPPGAPPVLYNINVTGQITMTGTGGTHTTGSWGCSSSGPGACRNSAIRLTGCGTQTLQGIPLATPEQNRSYLPGLIVDKTCGNVDFKDAVGVKSLFWLTPAADAYLVANPGVFNTAGSTFDFMSSSGDNNPECGGPGCVIPRSLAFNNLELHSSQNSDVVFNQSIIKVRGNFRLNPRMNNDNGWGGQALPNPNTIIDVEGDYEVDGSSGDQTFPNLNNPPIVRLSGSGNQKIIGHYHQIETRTGFQEGGLCATSCQVRAETQANIHINKPSGSVTLVGNIAFSRDFTLISLGTPIIANTSTLTTTSTHTNSKATISLPGVNLYDVHFEQAAILTGDLIIKNNLTIGNTTNLWTNIFGNSHRLNVSGDVTFLNQARHFFATFVLDGPATQNITLTNWTRGPANFSNNETPARIEINKPSATVNFYGNFDNSANYSNPYNVSSLNIVNGTVNMDPSSVIAVKTLTLSAGTTLNRNGAPLGYSVLSGTGTINP